MMRCSIKWMLSILLMVIMGVGYADYPMVTIKLNPQNRNQQMSPPHNAMHHPQPTQAPKFKLFTPKIYSITPNTLTAKKLISPKESIKPLLHYNISPGSLRWNVVKIAHQFGWKPLSGYHITISAG